MARSTKNYGVTNHSAILIARRAEGVDKLFKHGFSLHQQGDLAQAKIIYELVLAEQAKHFDALHLLGVIAVQSKNPILAEEFFVKAISVKPGNALAHYNRGIALHELKRFEEALLSYNNAISIRPDHAEAYGNQGSVLLELKRFNEALLSYGKALAINPDHADTHSNNGAALNELRRFDEALLSYDKAISINPDHAEAFGNRGNSLLELKRFDEALVSYEMALKLNLEGDLFYFGRYLHTQMQLNYWADFSKNIIRLENDICSGKKGQSPFPVLALIDKPELHQQAAQIFAAVKYPKNHEFGDFTKLRADGKIRIGYYSADFHNHATTNLIAELFETHDHRQFEVYGFSFGPHISDEMRGRVSRSFSEFFEVSSVSDRDIIKLSRRLGVDIAIDLKGFTQGCRTGIFAGRCAPLQVSYLGYPGTMSVDYIDYIIADKTVIAEGNREYFTEKVIFLPNSYQVNDSKRKIAEILYTKSELGLPQNGFIFCCFNTNYKILPTTFDGWMRILKAVDGSVLWLFENNLTAASNLRKEAQARGVDSNRLVFAKNLELSAHLARYRLADLFIDTFPCGAHTTASDALWSGLPVLTCMGKSFASRVAGSLLNAIDAPELIMDSQNDYEAKAIELALNPFILKNIKDKISRNKLIAPIFNTEIFTVNIEAAYKEIFQRYQNGLEPTDIYI